MCCRYFDGWIWYVCVGKIDKYYLLKLGSLDFDLRASILFRFLSGFTFTWLYYGSVSSCLSRSCYWSWTRVWLLQKFPQNRLLQESASICHESQWSETRLKSQLVRSTTRNWKISRRTGTFSWKWFGYLIWSDNTLKNGIKCSSYSRSLVIKWELGNSILWQVCTQNRQCVGESRILRRGLGNEQNRKENWFKVRRMRDLPKVRRVQLFKMCTS